MYYYKFVFVFIFILLICSSACIVVVSYRYVNTTGNCSLPYLFNSLRHIYSQNSFSYINYKLFVRFDSFVRFLCRPLPFILVRRYTLHAHQVSTIQYSNNIGCRANMDGTISSCCTIFVPIGTFFFFTF